MAGKGKGRGRARGRGKGRGRGRKRKISAVAEDEEPESDKPSPVQEEDQAAEEQVLVPDDVGIEPEDGPEAMLPEAAENLDVEMALECDGLVLEQADNDDAAAIVDVPVPEDQIEPEGPSSPVPVPVDEGLCGPHEEQGDVDVVAQALQPSPAEEPMHDIEGAAAAQPPEAEEPAPARVARSSGPKVYSTPELMEELQPSKDFRMGINYNDHRFFVKCSIRDDRFVDPYHKQSFSKTFKMSVTGSWEKALSEVHCYTWSKFRLLSTPPDKTAQEPGQIPRHVLQGLQAEMAKLPKPKEYKR